MQRPTLYRIVPLIVLALTLAATRALAVPPNVVILLSDDQRWTDYGFMGHPHIATPNLDRLARQSLTFTRGYVPTSLCRPSLATIVTGLYPHQHGITGNDPAFPAAVNKQRARTNPADPNHARFQHLIDRFNSRPNLLTILRDAGYLTYQCGKWWEGDPRKSGFTHAMSHGDPARGGRHGDVGLQIGRKGIDPVVEFLDEAQKANKPFLLWYAPMMPHEPHTPPAEYLAPYSNATAYPGQAKYWAMCEWFDFTCGQVLDELDRRGLADNTLVIYLCDNGFNPTGPYRDAGGGKGGERAKRSQFDAGTRTPIMIRFPGRVSPNTDRTTLVSSIDLLPTILAALDIDPPANARGLPGLNLLDADARSKRTALFGEILDHDIADPDNPAATLHYRWIVDGHDKLIVPSPANRPGESPVLYDLATDEFEQRNLAADRPDAVAALRAKLDAWWKP